MKTTKFVSLVTGLATAALVLPSATAEDWPRWGGNDPGRNMYSPAKGLPDHFTTDKEGKIEFKPGTEELDLKNAPNVKWAAQLGSQSFGNVVVAGGKVLLGTNNEHPRDPQHQGDRSILLCFDEKTGSFLWQLVVPKLASGKVNDWESLGLLSSPCVEGNRVYVVTSRCEVLCLDLDGMANGNDGPYMDEAQYVVGPGKPKAKIGPKDADIIWRYDMMDELGVFPHNASNCSVIIVGDLIYVCTSNGQDWTHSNIPSPNSPSFIALNKKTGELVGEDDAHIGPHIFHGQWSSPSAGVVNGKQLVFFGGGDGLCYAFDAKPVKEGDTSYLKKVWWYDCNPPEHKINKEGKPFKYPEADGPSEVNATPVFYKNRIYVAAGQDPEHGEGVGNLSCIDATKTGDVTKTAKIWSYDKIHRSIATVSIDPATGLLFVGDFSGFLHCLDAETGQLYWTHDMKAHMWGSTLVADGKVYVGDEDGDLFVFAASKEKKILSSANLGAAIYSTPIVANGVIYISSQTYLFALQNEVNSGAKIDLAPKIDINLKKP
ncbi:MAG: secondary metabolism, biosynthesis of secondary products derived from primary amino acid [Pedosphaera sp.]|nr:secondary metabolism, biosynthesis of secondary products derived from primary amino acid [Pedosphaera sp.]